MVVFEGLFVSFSKTQKTSISMKIGCSPVFCCWPHFLHSVSLMNTSIVYIFSRVVVFCNTPYLTSIYCPSLTQEGQMEFLEVVRNESLFILKPEIPLHFISFSFWTQSNDGNLLDMPENGSDPVSFVVIILEASTTHSFPLILASTEIQQCYIFLTPPPHFCQSRCRYKSISD